MREKDNKALSMTMRMSADELVSRFRHDAAVVVVVVGVVVGGPNDDRRRARRRLTQHGEQRTGKVSSCRPRETKRNGRFVFARVSLVRRRAAPGRSGMDGVWLACEIFFFLDSTMIKMRFENMRSCHTDISCDSMAHATLTLAL